MDPSLPQRVAAYRSGYLPEERRALEKSLRSGELLGVSSTSALELGIDISGLDAVLVAGWPGTRASLFQQIGRAGRAGQDAVAAFVASDDPLDTYLVNHPEAIFDVSVEATVFDPSNPYVLGPHLCAAAAELPLGNAELDLFGATSEKLLDQLVAQGYLRRRPAGWFWTHPQSAAAMVNLRADGGGPVSIVDADTGSLLGTMDSPQTHYQAHTGAIYVHQGESYVVEDLNEDDHCVMVRRANPDYYTTARDVTQIEVLETLRTTQWGDVAVHFGDVKVTTQVVSFQRKALISNEILGEEPLQLGARDLFTKAVWFVVDNRSLTGAGLIEAQFPGALHAAEHAAIGLLPLVASSDRWDIGGVSTAIHADTGVPTIFVYDGHPGGAGFAERGYDKARVWLAATRDAIEACECESGCPSCVQSPKCGNKNNPLDKDAAVTLIDVLLRDATDQMQHRGAGPRRHTAAGLAAATDAAACRGDDRRSGTVVTKCPPGCSAPAAAGTGSRRRPGPGQAGGPAQGRMDIELGADLHGVPGSFRQLRTLAPFRRATSAATAHGSPGAIPRAASAAARAARSAAAAARNAIAADWASSTSRTAVARTSIPSPSARTVPAPRSGDSWDSGCGPSGDPGCPKHSRASGCPGHSGCLPGAGMRGCGVVHAGEALQLMAPGPGNSGRR